MSMEVHDFFDNSRFTYQSTQQRYMKVLSYFIFMTSDAAMKPNKILFSLGASAAVLKIITESISKMEM